MTLFIYRMYMFVPVAQKVVAGTKCVADWPGTKEDKTFDVIEYQTAGITTHIACSTAMTQAMRDKLANLLTVIGTIYFICDANSGKLIETNNAPSQGKIGQMFGIADCEHDTGLVRNPAI